MTCGQFFIGKVDLDKIKITPKEQKIWLSEVESSFGKEHDIEPETFEYLQFIIGANAPRFDRPKSQDSGKYGGTLTPKKIGKIYIFIPNCPWSFIIYESVPQGKTVL